MPNDVRSVYAYELHGHDARGPLNYEDFFSALARTSPAQRQYRRRNSTEVVAVPEIRVEDGRYLLRFVIGREGDPALFYDLESGRERRAEPGTSEVSVQTAWLIIDPRYRLVVQERRRPGVPLQEALRALVGIGRDQDLAPNPTISLGPIVESTFADEVEELDRIKSATIVLQQPNMSWTSAADSVLAEYAEDSNIGTIEIGATARPKESLSKGAGIVQEIKQMVASSFSPLKNARIVGRRSDEKKDRTVSLRKHAKRREIEIPSEATRAEEREAVLAGSLDYLDDLKLERGVPAEDQ